MEWAGVFLAGFAGAVALIVTERWLLSGLGVRGLVLHLIYALSELVVGVSIGIGMAKLIKAITG